MAAKIITLKTLALSAVIILLVEAGLQWVPWPRSVSPLSLIGWARLIEALLILAVVQLSSPLGVAAIGLQPKRLVAGFKKGLIRRNQDLHAPSGSGGKIQSTDITGDASI